MIDQMLERYNLLLTVEVRAFWVIVGLYAIALLLHLAHALAAADLVDDEAAILGPAEGAQGTNKWR